MAYSRITFRAGSSGGEIFTMPAPYRGVIKAGNSIIMQVASATLITALGGDAAITAANLIVEDLPAYSGTSDTFYENSAMTFPGSITATTSVVSPSAGPTLAQQHTLPAVTSDTIALLAAAQTLAAKTFTGVLGFTMGAGRQHGTQGANVAAANNLVLGTDGNVFAITGAIQINLLDRTSFQNGSRVTLIFASTPTVKHATATSGNNTTILLVGAVDFVATANDVLELMLCTDGTTQAWREMGRSVI